MNHCKDCLHFGPEYPTYTEAGDGMKGSGYHECLFIKHAGDEWDLVDATANAAVVDGSGYFARLTVRDDFGCVNFGAPPTGNRDELTGEEAPK
jgi:hypothetical protein